MRAIKELWTPTSRHYDRADEGYPKKHVLDCGIAWQNYQDSAGVFQEIDLSPELIVGGLRVRKVPYDLTLLTTGARTVMPDRNNPAKSILFPANKFLANKTFQKVGNGILWDSARYAIDIHWENSRVKFNVIAKRSIPFDQIQFDMDKTGLSDVELLALITHLKAVDSSKPEPIVRPLDVNLNAGVLTLGFDLTGMTFPVVIDPTLDLQVGASADDVGMSPFSITGYLVAGKVGSTIYRNAARFTGVSGLSGVTIDVSYYTVYVDGNPGAGSALTKVSAEDATAPAQIVDSTDFGNREASLTTAQVDWDGFLAADQSHNSPSIVSVIQELANSYNPSVIQIFVRDDGSTAGNWNRWQSYNQSSTNAPKLHTEYTAGGGAARRVFIVT